MKTREEEYKELFLAEASAQYEELNRYFVVLEKDQRNTEAIQVIFRIMHTLKANASAMGFEPIYEMAHLLEDIFSEIKSQKLILTTDIFNDLFRANDKLGEMINAITNPEKKVSYKGLRAKLQVLLDRSRQTENPQKPENQQKNEIRVEKKEGKTAEKAKNPELKKRGRPKKSETENITKTEINTVIEEKTKEQKPEKESDSEEVIQTNPNEFPTHQIAFADIIQVPVAKLDNLLNLVSELSIEKDRIITSYTRQMGLSNEFSLLNRLASDLQYSVMNVRLVQISLLFNKFHRIVRDIAQFEGKQVNLVLEGTEIEIDRNILQTMSDSLIHLVRNSISHGIENAEERKTKGKNPIGTIKLAARNDKDNVIIEVTDDGKGIDSELIKRKIIEKNLVSLSEANKLSEGDLMNFIFVSGFSSASKITAVSGRGVGMDVVKKTVESIGGKINMSTKKNKGTTFGMELPASMAVRSVLLFELGETEFAIPLSFTEAVIQVEKAQIHKVGKGLMTTYLEKTVSVVFLKDVFSVRNLNDLQHNHILQKTFDQLSGTEKLSMIVVSMDNKHLGLVVDRLLQQKEIIEKPMNKPLDATPFMSGATILGNGNVCLVLDIPSMVKYLFRK